MLGTKPITQTTAAGALREFNPGMPGLESQEKSLPGFLGGERAKQK
jgi:hypothetical protein